MPLLSAIPAPADAATSTMVAQGSARDDLELLLQRFLDAIVDLAGAQAGAVRVMTDDGQHMRLVAQQGLPAAVQQAERLVKRDCGMCGVAATADVLGWVADARSCVQSGPKTYFGVQCMGVLAIPMSHAHQVLGVYTLFFEAKTEVDPATSTILRLIGQLLGLALHNARIERERLRLTVLKERQEMVNEVHDSIAQTLAYARMRLPLLKDAMLAHDDSKSIKYFSDLKQAVGEVHDNLREVMTYFRTRMDPLGLLHALEGVAHGYFERTGITLQIRNTVQNLNLHDVQEVEVFHIVQESLANIAKHSMAQNALISIHKTPEWLEFVIEDDGLGPSGSTSSHAATAHGQSGSTHLGLEIMHSRAQRLGGHLEIGERVGGGTRVRLLCPINPVASERPS